VWKYSPDVVLLAFYPARDIANNLRELNNAANPEQSPYYVHQQSRLVEDDSFRELPALQPKQIEMQKLRYWINEHVKTFEAISAFEREARLRFATAAMQQRAQQFGVVNLEYSIYAPPQSDTMRQAWEVTEGLLAMMRDEVKSHAAELRVVVLATRPEVLPDPAKRAELLSKLGVKDFSYANRRIEEFGAREKIAVTTLGPALGVYAADHGVYLNGFNDRNWGAGHWNESGHRLAGEVIAADLCRDVVQAREAGRR